MTPPLASPGKLVQGIEDRYESPLHETRNAAWLGLALGVAFTLCFATGLWSHLAQDPPSWFTYPARPAGFYRVTQGIHVASGMAAIPLLVAKLWVVHPRLFVWPPAYSVVHAVERLALLPLVGGGVFLLFSGMANVARWYPWTFFFPRAHFWAAWITIGALIVHIGAKSAATWDALRREPRGEEAVKADPTERRRFLGGVAAASGALVVATIGGTLAIVSPFSVLSQRRPGFGPQGLPVNKTAKGARVTTTAVDPAYRLEVVGAVERPLSLSLDDLRALPQHEAELPIACVEGWSTSAHWRGIRARDLLDLAGASAEATATVESLQPKGRYRKADLNRDQVSDSDTLFALEVNGETLHIDHGYPIRLVGPNRPGVLQTKWVSRITVT